jgi:hypothetical protein
MEAVYQQQAMPTNITGVPITLSVVDANGNYRTIGSVTSDGSGMFTYTWKPDIQGNYIVVASFAGSGAYYPSYAETSFFAGDAAATISPNQPQTLPPTEMYIIGATVAIIVAIAIVGALVLLAVKKRP